MKLLTTKGRNVCAAAAAAVALLAPCAGIAATPAKDTKSDLSAKSDLGALKDEVQRLRTEIEAMRGELRSLTRRLAQAPDEAPTPQRSTVAIEGGAVLGQTNAPLTLVEFSDYQCPFCRRYHDQTFAKIKAQYVDTGKLRYVFRDFPLDSIHPQARKAAEAAHCAQDQGKYWEAHDLFFRNQDRLQPENLKAYAATLGLKADAFGECLDKAKYAGQVQANEDGGVKAGVRGTPTFFVGKTTKEGPIDGLLIIGARPYEDFQREIDKLLAAK